MLNKILSKSNSHSTFDVTMGSYDGAEIWELVGIFILEKLSKLNDKNNNGLYRDDGLMLIRLTSKRLIEKMKQSIIDTFKDIGFDIDILTNLKVVNFLDLTLDLTNGIHRPYKKPNDRLLYVNTSSNHPSNILKQLPTSINKRLSTNSSNETIFNEAKTEYENALKNSGYKNFKLKFDKPKTRTRKRRRNIIWFNPPFNKNVSTNVARSFLRLIDKHFTHENGLRKIFNRNNVKVSYSCTQNIGSIIKSHNKKLLSQINDTDNTDEPCNCTIKDDCPLEGNCQISSVIYKCEVTGENLPKKVYLGLTERTFKERYNEHKSSINNERYKNSTTLSTYIWDMKSKGVIPTLKWSIVSQTKAYNNNSKTCQLCLNEKLEILSYKNKRELLNKRSEIIAKCRHINKYILANYKSKD